MVGRNISISILIIICYVMIAQLPLLSRGGGTDILSEGLTVISLVLHFAILLFIYLARVIRRKYNKNMRVQLLFVFSIILAILVWNRIQWYQLPKEERMKTLLWNDKMQNKFLVVLKSNGKYQFVNKWGNVVISDEYDDVKSFGADTITGVKINDKWGYINREGKTLIPFQFDEADNFYEGFAAVKQYNLWGVINLKGKWVITPKYEKIIQPFQNGKALGQIKDDTIKINYPR